MVMTPILFAVPRTDFIAACEARAVPTGSEICSLTGPVILFAIALHPEEESMLELIRKRSDAFEMPDAA